VILELRMGPGVVADYDGMLLVQSLPFELKTPAGLRSAALLPGRVSSAWHE
jgi:hypothetical protein